MLMPNVFSMGGYGVYVWSAYAISLAVFGLNLILSWRERKAVKQFIQQYLSGAIRNES
jgi:heme exporter protein CcmD